MTRKINVPTLVAFGQRDNLWCTNVLTGPDCNVGPLAQGEHKYWSPAAQYELHITPAASHSINVSTPAPIFFDACLEWLKRHGLDERR